MRTSQQEKIYSEFRNGAFNEMVSCHEKAVEALKSIVDLPYTENGEAVKHHDNLDMKNVAEYYVGRRDAIISILPRSEIVAWCDENDVSFIAMGKLPWPK